MSYLVLARKWRPRRFAELVGQEHVVRALGNALDSGRVHHAFLFTGTRGVGKTTIARIFAKSLNCERGTSAEPCGECDTCRAVDAGRFIDLLEIDAASNTGVDDVRELIENAQYMPSRGRVKVYLIDEVHMLSKSAFNALLKTLEEPPEHVKFLLATTDPQKLPVTVLSRCLQFNLKRLDEAQISGQMRMILGEEGITADDGAIRLLAKGADGSLRDGLSLLDQAIAYTGGHLEAAAVATMLGTVDHHRVGALLSALVADDGAALLEEVARLAELSPDWGSLLEAIAQACHQLQIKQLVPAAEVQADGFDVAALAAQVSAERVQIWYQMAVQGRRELPYAPSPRAGAEMALLRMLAFVPDAAADARTAPSGGASAGASAVDGRAAAARARESLESPVRPAAAARAIPASSPAPAAPARASAAAAPAPATAASVAAAPELPAATPPRRIADADDWVQTLAALPLRGAARELAEHVGFLAHDGNCLRLSLDDSDEHLRAPALIRQLADALQPVLGVLPQLQFERAQAADTLRQRRERDRDQKQAEAEAAFHDDPVVRHFVAQGATVVADSIQRHEA